MSGFGQLAVAVCVCGIFAAAGADNFWRRFFVHIETHLPILVSWATPGRPMPEGRGAPGAPSSPGALAPPVVQSAPTHTIEQTAFDHLRINPKIDPRRFEVRR